MKIDIDYKVPDSCDFCKFLKRVTTKGSWGRANTYYCIITGEGDISCEWRSEEITAEKRMRKSCPFLKSKTGYIESRDIEGVYK